MADGDQRYFVTGLETFMNARKPSVRMTGGGQIALEGLGLWLKGALVFFVLPPEAASSVAGLTAESSAQLQSLSLALLDIAPSKGATKALAFTFKNELQQGFFEGELGIIGKLVPGAPVFSAATMLPVGAVISNDDTHARLEAYDVRIESVAMPLEFLLQQAARYRNFCLRTESLKALAAPQFDRSKLEDLEIASLVTAVRTKLLSQSVARGMKMDDPHAERLMGDFAKGLAIFAKSDLVHFELEYFFQKAQAQLPQRQEYLKQAAKTMTAEKITK